MRNAEILVGNPGGKEPLWRPRRKLESRPDIKMYLRKSGCEDVELIQ
jgi:hypothetical protein